MPQTVRNIAIIAALAALVALVPGGGDAGEGILQALVIAMLSFIAWFAVRLYREHRTDLYALGDRRRALLYGSLGLITLTITATDRLWDTGIGLLAWFALIGVGVYGAYAVVRAARQY